MVVSQNKVTPVQNRPQNTIVLIMGTPKRVPPNFRKPPCQSVPGDNGNDSSGRLPSPTTSWSKSEILNNDHLIMFASSVVILKTACIAPSVDRKWLWVNHIKTPICPHILSTLGGPQLQNMNLEVPRLTTRVADLALVGSQARESVLILLGKGVWQSTLRACYFRGASMQLQANIGNCILQHDSCAPAYCSPDIALWKSAWDVRIFCRMMQPRSPGCLEELPSSGCAPLHLVPRNLAAKKRLRSRYW